MKIIFHQKTTFKGPPKATIHNSGKLGFSAEAEKTLGLDKEMYLKIGTSSEEKDDSLYVMISDKLDSYSFPVLKAGNYFYVNAKGLFNELKIEYLKEKVIYDIEEVDYEGQKIFKFNKRKIKNKKSMPSE